VNPLERLHDAWQVDRRVQVLARLLDPLLPRSASVLDVGAGDGRIAAALSAARPDLRIEGLDVQERPRASIPVRVFDGRRIPCEGDDFDAVLFVDVLHHAEDAATLLGEARRVARRCVVIKDHLLQGLLAGPTLRFMDRVGNARHGVALPHHYWPESRWRETWAALDLPVDTFETRLGLYPVPLRWIFERQLHFVARLNAGPPHDVAD
jgi:SAM-dependent methyltransferase